MKIGGLERISLIDYPSLISAVVFTKGCNFNCSFCYNPMLVCPKGGIENTHEMGDEGRSHQIKEEVPLFDEDDLFRFLKTRIGKLDAVVITGGEPTMQRDLPEFITKVKEIGFLVKLDTNGTNPEMLEQIISKKLVDYIAMDLKADWDGYENTTQVKVSQENIKKSIELIMNSNIPYEFRTTCVPELINIEMIENMGKIINRADKWYLQKFKSDTNLVNNSFKGKDSFTDSQMDEFIKIGKKYTSICEKRG